MHARTVHHAKTFLRKTLITKKVKPHNIVATRLSKVSHVFTWLSASCLHTQTPKQSHPSTPLSV